MFYIFFRLLFNLKALPNCLETKLIYPNRIWVEFFKALIHSVSLANFFKRVTKKFS